MKTISILRTALLLGAISTVGCMTGTETPATCSISGSKLECSQTLQACLDDDQGMCTFPAFDKAANLNGFLTLDQNLTWSFSVDETAGQKSAGTWSWYPAVPGTPGSPEGQIVFDGNFTGSDLVVYGSVSL